MHFGEAGRADDMLCRVTHQPLLLLDGKGRVCRGSEGAWRLFGVCESDVIGRQFSEILPRSEPVSQHDGDALLEEARLSLKAVSDYRSRRHSDGRLLWLDMHIEFLSAEDGVSTGFVVTMTDVSEHHLAEEQLHDSLRMLHDAEQAAGLGHWRLDLLSEAITWSPGVYHIHGFDPDQQVELEEALDSYIAEDRPHIEQLIADAIARRQGFAFRATLRRPDNTLRMVDVKGSVEADDEGRALALFGVIHDRTAENLATRRLIDARDEAARAAEANMMLLATMSHEIRTPLSGIIGMIDAQLSGDGNEDREVSLRAMQAASRSLMVSLNDVLDHARMTSGRFELDSTVFDMAEVLHATADLFQASAKDKQLLLEREVHGALGVIGDPARLQQIVSNFLSNAIKFTSSGSVRLSLKEEADDRLLIEVSDTGIGIAPSVQETLFTPFQQADRSISGRFGGTGLGLSICRLLAEAMGGTVGVESQVGVGSRFWLRVTLARTDLPLVAQPDLSRAEVLPRVAGRSPHVLVVDDTQTNRLVAEGCLRAIGATTEEASNGLEALQKLCATTFDAVLMDSAMPLVDGGTCLRLMRRLPHPFAHVPVLGYSAGCEEGEVGVLPAVDGVLGKPLERERLLNLLAPLLECWAGDHGVADVRLTFDAAAAFSRCLDALGQALVEEDRQQSQQALAELAQLSQSSQQVALQQWVAFIEHSLQELDAPLVQVLMPSIEQLLVRLQEANRGLSGEVSA
ncbi:response regulator [Halomonas sp. DP8Y7-3]|uniref:PAS domain-containing hybrid sensor histidine kinase/response regulator n=1 Tax=Halomonas sp. DP8Y7-3 TaxID=2859079 RepID=UPI001C93C25D|nr:PAS domain-containing hybrid sensor histidine kinase/response regulator [Halomonas sp. DP8Y7-3]MBY5928194.1 response regulator [Halomonas sp. DP8Y7-3]